LDGLPATGLEQSTVGAYRTLIEVHAIPELGDTPLQSLDPMMLDRLYAKMLRDGRRDGQGGLSPRTTRFTHTVLRKALADAVRKGLLVANPADRATPPSTKAARPPEMKFWTPEELYAFLESIDTGDRLFGMWRVLALTGLRRGEVAGLRWQDVDLHGDEQDPGRIRVAQQYKPDGRGGFVFGAPKSEQGRRTVNLDPETVVVLRDHRQRQLDERSQLGLSDRPQLVFTNVDGGPIRPDSGISKRFDRLVRETDLPRIRLHDLRHTHSAHLIASGTDLKAISTRLGHASASFTLDRYGHLLPGRQAEAAARVAAMVDDYGRNPAVPGRRQEL
jgi:integrase